MTYREVAEYDQELPAPSDNGADSDASVDSVVPITVLIVKADTIPFVGLTPTTDIDYPEPVSPVADRFAPGDPLSFKEAIQCLPQAGEGELWADNEFVDPDGAGAGDVAIDVNVIRAVHGLDIEHLEVHTGRSIEQLAAGAEPDPLVRVDDHKDTDQDDVEAVGPQAGVEDSENGDGGMGA